MFVELEFSTSENLLVRKQKLEIKEDNLPYQNYRKLQRFVGAFFLNRR